MQFAIELWVAHCDYWLPVTPLNFQIIFILFNFFFFTYKSIEYGDIITLELMKNIMIIILKNGIHFG